MSLRQHTTGTDRAQRPARPAVVARAAADTATGDVLQLQRAFGNRAVTQLQRQPTQGGELAAPISDTINRTRGGGHPLPDRVRGSMESAFRSDFGGVRVHTDQSADTLNRSVQAKAFTLGHDIYFRKGNYQPGHAKGQELLAHELTHVVQQGGAQSGARNRASGAQAKLTVGPVGDRYEQEADRVAKQVVQHQTVTRPAAGPGHIQRQLDFDDSWQATKWSLGLSDVFGTYTKQKESLNSLFVTLEQALVAIDMSAVNGEGNGPALTARYTTLAKWVTDTKAKKVAYSDKAALEQAIPLKQAEAAKLKLDVAAFIKAQAEAAEAAEAVKAQAEKDERTRKHQALMAQQQQAKAAKEKAAPPPVSKAEERAKKKADSEALMLKIQQDVAAERRAKQLAAQEAERLKREAEQKARAAVIALFSRTADEAEQQRKLSELLKWEPDQDKLKTLLARTDEDTLLGLYRFDTTASLTGLLKPTLDGPTLLEMYEDRGVEVVKQFILATPGVNAAGLKAALPAYIPTVARADLPQRARNMLALIEAGGPYEYDEDDETYHNYYKAGCMRLPIRADGTYREYTVETPDSENRAKRRIVKNVVDDIAYYTNDHYKNFRQVV